MAWPRRRGPVGRYIAADISAMLIQEWRRIRIHAAMPIAMFVAMTMASTSARAGSPGQIRVHSRPSSIMPTSICGDHIEVMPDGAPADLATGAGVVGDGLAGAE